MIRMIAGRNIRVNGWSKHETSTSMKSHDHHNIPIRNEMTTPNGVHDVTTPRENLAEIITCDLLPIAIFAQYFSMC